MADSIPVKRLGTIEDISHLICFLASSDAGFINGETDEHQRRLLHGFGGRCRQLVPRVWSVRARGLKRHRGCDATLFIAINPAAFDAG